MLSKGIIITKKEWDKAIEEIILIEMEIERTTERKWKFNYIDNLKK